MRELVEKRTASTETWENDDGTRSVRQFASGRHFQRPGSTEWSPIDSSLSAVPGRPGWWASNANEWQVLFGPPGAPGGSEQLLFDGRAVGVVPLGISAAAPAPAVEGSTARYVDLWPGVDARYRVLPEGVEEDLVLKRPGTPARFGFDLEGATVRPNDEGGLDVMVDGRKAASVPAPVVSTARGPVSADVAGARLSVGRGPKASRIEISVGESWLAGVPVSDYPVVIDPAVQRSLAPVAVKSLSRTQVITGRLQVGSDRGTQWRGAALFPVPA